MEKRVTGGILFWLTFRTERPSLKWEDNVKRILKK